MCIRDRPNTVKYRLLPTEEKWNTNYDDHIKLSNINPGKYVLEIRSSYPLEENEQIDVYKRKVEIPLQKFQHASVVQRRTRLCISLIQITD